MSKNNLKNILYTVGLIVLVGGLFIYPVVTDPNRPLIKAWNAAGIGCLAGHTNLSQHIHQQISITVDGNEEKIPGNTGIVPACMAELHVHDGEPNLIHLESIAAGKKFKLSDFFIVYGKPLIREGYKLEVTLNGAKVEDPANLILEDKQILAVKYTKEN